MKGMTQSIWDREMPKNGTMLRSILRLPPKVLPTIMEQFEDEDIDYYIQLAKRSIPRTKRERPRGHNLTDIPKTERSWKQFRTEPIS